MLFPPWKFALIIEGQPFSIKILCASMRGFACALHIYKLTDNSLRRGIWNDSAGNSDWLQS
jgi:hypothetical protein